ncbi:MAG: queuosine precursor transporter [Symploca sp. SIO2B6]|nr:queuosine precursor transporter [Symploca sp. SIO2B6]
MPSSQYSSQGLPPNPPLSIPKYVQDRRDLVFLILSGIFLGTLTMLNILGISRFVNVLEWGNFAMTIAVGALPYPITFLCTDLISELYGQKRANQLVWVGLMLNIWVVFILWLGGVLPGFEPLDPATGEILRDAADRLPVFFEVRNLTFGTVVASMIAYLTAQFVDVKLFHFWKDLTQGRYLWLRNNGSTLISQLIDTSAVVIITYFLSDALPLNPTQSVWSQLVMFILFGYIFKLIAALLDTGPFYLCVYWLSHYLKLDSPISSSSGISGINRRP